MLKRGIDSLVYVDESGFESHVYRSHGWAMAGNKVHGHRLGRDRRRTSLVLAQCRKSRFAPLLFEGTCHTQLFNTWVDKVLLPCLKKGQTVIMEQLPLGYNASFHKSKRTKQLIESAGCYLLYLPPYSPDFNPIEKTFGWLKHKRVNHSFESIDQLICSIL